MRLRRGRDCRTLLLVDNLGVALALERARAPDYGLLKIVRSFWALALARCVSVAIRWTPCELNIADEPSRVFIGYVSGESRATPEHYVWGPTCP